MHAFHFSEKLMDATPRVRVHGFFLRVYGIWECALHAPN
jgi:hypothetical protein